MSRMGVWFSEEVHVYRRKKSTEWVAAGYELAGKVKCLVQPASGGMATTNGAVMPNASYTLFAEADSDIILGDKIVDVYGRTYVVTSVPKDRGISGIRDHMEVAMELQNA
jgi:hypothetical protein